MLAQLREPAVTALTVQTLRHGRITAPVDQITTLTKPLLGFPKLKQWFFYQTRPGTVHWMQSIEDPQVGLCLLAPFQAGLDPDMEIGNEEVCDIGAEDASDIDVFTVVVLDRDPVKHRTNLRAPILVCRTTRLAKQVVLHDARLPIRFFLRDLKPFGR